LRAFLDGFPLAVRMRMRILGLLLALLAVPLPSAGAQDAGAPRQDDTERDTASNINARYTVESVEISGVATERVSQTLRDDLQALVGNRLDPEQAERLDERLTDELPGHRVRRRMARGSQQGRIRLIFEVTEAEGAYWIPFARSRSKVLYHSDLGWSGGLDLPIGGRRTRAVVGLAFDNDDDLIEEFSGYGLRIESRKVGTDRLGVSLEVARYHQTWRPETLDALPASPRIPEAYRTRLTVEPLVTFAFNPRVRVTGGISVSELESLTQSPESQMANAVVLSAGYDQRWDGSDSEHEIAASYEWRSATEALESDLDYRRHAAQARYEYEQGRSAVIASVFLGRITGGAAPLFERFSLGSSTTLRGWNKFDVAPTGGDRAFHQSVEYRYRGLALFLDAGSVWDEGVERKTRFSTGFGFHGDNAFVTLGFPLNADDVGASFMMGVRF
jgi:hypothetical protein